MDITYRIKSVNGDTSFQHVTLKITSSAEGDYFDMKGNYLGSTSQSKKNIYIVGRDTLGNPYSMGTLPNFFFDKQASFVGIENIVNLEAGRKYGTIITDLSRETRIKTSQNIYNHYYTEAGFDLNRLKYKNITNSDELNRHLSVTDIKKRDDEWTSSSREIREGTGYAITRIGGYSNFSEYLKKCEAEISISYGHIGINFDTGFDIMSICAHEHKHLEDCINDVKNNTKINSETRAYSHQTLVDKNWKYITLGLKSVLRQIASQVMYKEDYFKAFGDEKQYKNIEWKPGKNITL